MLIYAGWLGLHTLISVVVLELGYIAWIWLKQSQSHNLFVLHDDTDEAVRPEFPLNFSGHPHIIHPPDEHRHHFIHYLE